MTKEEFFDQVARRLNAGWPHSRLPNASLAMTFDTLRDLPADQVVAAIEALHREGREFAPTGGMIRLKLVELATDAPDWPAVRKAIRACLSYPERRAVDGGFVNERELRLQRESELIRRFVQHVSWEQAATVIDSEDTAAEAQIRNKWNAFVSGDRGDQALAGLPSAGLARLVRVNGEREQIGAGVLKQIDQGAK